MKPKKLTPSVMFLKALEGLGVFDDPVEMGRFLFDYCVNLKAVTPVEDHDKHEAIAAFDDFMGEENHEDVLIEYEEFLRFMAWASEGYPTEENGDPLAPDFEYALAERMDPMEFLEAKEELESRLDEGEDLLADDITKYYLPDEEAVAKYGHNYVWLSRVTLQ